MNKETKSVKKIKKQAESREKERKALELRKAGMTYQQIADTIGYSSPSSAHSVVKRALERISDEPADDLRKIMDERLNTLLMVTWPHAQGGDPTAVNQALRIMDRQAQLRGLDAPQRIEHLGETKHSITIGGSQESFIDALRAYRTQALGLGEGAPIAPQGGGTASSEHNGSNFEVGDDEGVDDVQEAEIVE